MGEKTDRETAKADAQPYGKVGRSAVYTGTAAQRCQTKHKSEEK